jgi:hypothetical protein
VVGHELSVMQKNQVQFVHKLVKMAAQKGNILGVGG